MIKIEKSLFDYTVKEWSEKNCSEYRKEFMRRLSKGERLCMTDLCFQCAKDYGVDFCLLSEINQYEMAKEAIERLKKVNQSHGL